MVQEIDYYQRCIRTTNTADFKNCQKPKNPILQSASNINAPPNFFYIELYVKEIYINEGATLKRMRARAKGSGNRILKRTSHINVVVSDER